ncbi:hypothetical protein GCM10023091_40150 [Ravibacter arvi]|uniref:Sialate O-acetylesterase domain-containing protein n=2 Tax=Ravibacter arvi TaxID=2051041 RepID=A0ABP8MCN9_9BACT
MTQLGTSTSGYYYFSRSVPTGWYRFTIKDGTTEIRQIKFGVGEVFFIAGQSNAQGAGGTLNIPGTPDLDCVVSSKNISMEVNQLASYDSKGRPRYTFNGYPNILPPTMGVLTSSDPNIAPNGTRPWFFQSFGAQIATSELGAGRTVPVAFFNTAMGGSSIANWKTSIDKVRAMFLGNYTYDMAYLATQFQHNPWLPHDYDNFDTRYPYIPLKNYLSSFAHMFGARAVLWHQGEAETHSINISLPGYSVTDYRVKLKALIDDTRSYLPGLPWAICKVSYLTGGTNSSVIAEQQNVYSTYSNISWASENSDTYVASHRDPDNTHFNVSGLTAISNEIYANRSSIFAKTPILPINPARIYLASTMWPGYQSATTAAPHLRYEWHNSIHVPSFYQIGVDPPYDSTVFEANYGVSGFVKTFSGNLLMMAPGVSFWGLSGARIGIEPLPEMAESKSEKSYAFPNPTNPSEEVLTIYFGLKETSNISLKVYDRQGRLLEQVSKEKMPAGGHEIKFPVSSLKNAGEMVIYHLLTEEHNETKKVLLVK